MNFSVLQILLCLFGYMFCAHEALAVPLPKPIESFQSNGKSIHLEWFLSPEQVDQKTQRSLVLILHGSGGLDNKGGFFRELATGLAKRGHNAVVIHYFDQTNNKTASNADMSRYFSVWLRTVEGATAFCKKQPFVDSRKVSLLGHSLGAQLALQSAANSNEVYSVIDMSGCFVLPVANLKSMPPVLILHGKADNVVPISREKALVETLKKIGSPYEEHLFRHSDHAFTDVPFDEILSLSDNFLNR